MKIMRNENQLECHFEGRLDSSYSNTIAPQIDDAMSNLDKPLVFNLGKVEYISSAFLRICIKCSKGSQKHGFWVTNLNPNLRKVFKIAGLDQLCRY